MASNSIDRAVRCILCTREEMQDGERMLLLSCCRSGVHRTCVREKYPDTHLLTCPKCRCRARVTGHLIQRDQFSTADSDKIDLCFAKHHNIINIPMTKGEIQGLRIALNVRGYRAMRHLSRRVFVVGLAFWIPLPKEKLCDWEDIVSRLSLGLIWNMVSEMRHRYALRVERDGKGSVFHHFVDYLLSVCVQDDAVATRDCVVQTCRESGEKCTECTGFASVFDGERITHCVALANRTYLYDRVGDAMYKEFVSAMKKRLNIK